MDKIPAERRKSVSVWSTLDMIRREFAEGGRKYPRRESEDAGDRSYSCTPERAEASGPIMKQWKRVMFEVCWLTQGRCLPQLIVSSAMSGDRAVQDNNSVRTDLRFRPRKRPVDYRTD